MVRLTKTQRRNARRRRAVSAREHPGSLKGYRLHDARIDWSGGEKSMRSVKVELLNLGATKADMQRGAGMQQAVANAVFHDYRWLYGPTNFADFLADPSQPSFLDLWVTAARLGVIMSNKSATEFAELRGGSSVGRIFESIPAELRARLDRAKWIAWYDKGIRNTSTAVSRQRALAATFMLGEVDGTVDARWNDGEADVLAGAPVASLGRPEFKQRLFGAAAQPTHDVKPSVAKRKWAIDPAFEPVDVADTTAALDIVIRQWRERLGDPATVKRFMGVGDNGNHLSNGLFGDFFEEIRNTEPAQLAAGIAEEHAFTAAERDNITGRLEKLHELALQLPARPALVRNWREYRSDMIAKLESWYSNREGKGRQAIEDVWGVEGDPKKRGLAGVLSDLAANADLDPDIAEGALADAIADIGPRRNSVDRDFTDMLQTRLAGLRDELNSFRQERAAEWERDHPVAKVGANPWEHDANTPIPKAIRALPRKVQSSPLFWGVDKRALWRKLTELKRLIAAGDQPGTPGRGGLTELSGILAEVLREVPGGAPLSAPAHAPASGNKQVQQLARLWHRLKDEGNANGAVVERLDRIGRALGVDFDAATRSQRFYLSGRERDKVSLLPTPNQLTIGRVLELADLASLYDAAAAHPERGWLLRDTVQLSKVVLSAALAVLDDGSRKHRDRGVALTLAHSNLQGFAFLLGRTEFISRATVQAVNGGQNLLAWDESQAAPHFYYVFPELEGAPAQPAELAIRLAKQGNIGTSDNFIDASALAVVGSEIRAPRGVANTLRVASSRYQLQFFTWFLARQLDAHQNKKTRLSAGGSFTIAEQQVRLDWSGAHPQIANTSEPRLFVSQPFTVVATERNRRERVGIPSRFVGVDVGEYGLAWSVWEFSNGYWDGLAIHPGRAKCLEKGFLAEPGQRLIRERVNRDRAGHAIRTFTSPETYVARLRENVVATYQARLEAIAMAFDAQIVFEREISAFETGGNRVKAIYDAVKRSTVLGSSGAEKADTKQHWGDISQKDHQAKRADQRLPWAKEVSAWMTSQTCTACGRAFSRAYRGKPGDLPDPSCAGEVRRFIPGSGHLERAFIDAGTTFANDAARRDFEKSVKAAMRPALTMRDGTVTKAGQLVFDYLAERGTLDDGAGFGRLNVTNPTELAEYEAERGRSAIFICPYTDCGHIADADLQASANIARLGYANAAMRAEHPDWFTGSLATNAQGQASRREWETRFDQAATAALRKGV